MSVSCDPVVRSVLVRGSCADWFPIVGESLRSNGFYGMSADLSALRFTAAYPGGSASVSLHPSADGLGTLISVSVRPYSSGGVVSC